MTMTKPLDDAEVWRTIEIRFDGRVVRGSWAHDGSMVQVRTPYADKTTQIGGSPPETLARIMLGELAKEGKA
jgi:hypothetical protein